jgi:hypothetical protein
VAKLPSRDGEIYWIARQGRLEVIAKPISGFILKQPKDLNGEIITPFGKGGGGDFI